MIWRRRQLIVWWLVSAAAVAGVTAWMVMNWHVRTQHGRGLTGALQRSAHNWLHANLNLTNEQHGRLEALQAIAEKEQGEQRARVMAAEKEVAEALREGTEKPAALQLALQKLSDRRAELQRAAADHYLAICKELDEAQRQAFLNWNSSQFDPP